MLFGQGAPGADYARNPFPDLARLREESPRHHVPERDAWFISRRADITTLLRDDRLTITRSSSFADRSAEFRTTVVRRLRGWFASSEPMLTRVVVDVAERCAADLARRRQADLVEAVAQFVPSRVMGVLLGIPPEDLPPLRRLCGEVLQSYDLEWSGGSAPAAMTAALPAYFQNHWRTAPDAPLMRPLRDLQAGHGAPDASMIDTCSKLFSAGATTTAGCIANVMARLVGAVDEPSIPIGADSVDNLLRRDGPMLALKRLVRETVQIGEATLSPGQQVFLLTACANREPVSADESRTSSLTFGLGRYHCLGAALARLELSAVLDLLVPLASRMRLAAPVAWREAWLIHEARSIRVTIDGAKHAD